MTTPFKGNFLFKVLGCGQSHDAALISWLPAVNHRLDVGAAYNAQSEGIIDGFNGLMDYFYVGNHLNDVGLLDIYGKLLWKSPKTEFSVVPHFFSAAAEVGENYDSYLGTEIDLVGFYKFRKDISVGIGYSQMFGTETLEVLKEGDKDRTQNWAWVMLSFSPQLFRFSPEKL